MSVKEVYEIWASSDESPYDLVREGDHESKRILQKNANFLKIIYANYYEDAATQMNQYLGWNDYKPFDAD